MTEEERKRRVEHCLEEARARVAGTWVPPPEPTRSSPMQRTNSAGDLVFKTVENALVAPAEAMPTVEPHTSDNWLTQEELERRLELEREIIAEGIGKLIKNVCAETEQRIAELKGLLSTTLKQLAAAKDERKQREAAFAMLTEKVAYLEGRVDGKLHQLATLADVHGLLRPGYDLS